VLVESQEVVVVKGRTVAAASVLGLLAVGLVSVVTAGLVLAKELDSALAWESESESE